MVGLKIRKRSDENAPYEQDSIVTLTRTLGLLSKGTRCRILRCGTREAEISPLVGRFAGQKIDIGVEFLE